MKTNKTVDHIITKTLQVIILYITISTLFKTYQPYAFQTLHYPLKMYKKKMLIFLAFYD